MNIKKSGIILLPISAMLYRRHLLSILFLSIVCLFMSLNVYGGTWFRGIVDRGGDVGSYSSMAIDSSGKLHISYYDATNLDLKYATNASGSWVTTTVDSAGKVGKYTAVALDVQEFQLPPIIPPFTGGNRGESRRRPN
ncbi:MAG: hypothetical protein CV087_17085 [Candidatus Brocadia sp. WS118]|nr:MAG: hypothetical protein CV087_17085 [Candidatus Brocadia sp. WS118]